MATFTVFFCGTGSNSFDYANPDYPCGELISRLARNAGGMEFVDWIIVDGPGSGNWQEDEKFVTPGNYATATGVAFGRGWEENVAHALAMIRGEATWSRQKLTELSYRVLKDAGIPIADEKITYNFLGREKERIRPDRKVTQQALQMQKIKIFRRGRPVTQVNAIGWSRGAVTTHMFANAMAADPTLRDLPLNIIAVDPVPGTGNFQKHRTTIPSNVRNYVAFYARDERSMGFAATLPTIASPSKTRAICYPMPGRHATLVGNPGNYIGGNGINTFYGPGRVVRALSESYLDGWGTALNNRSACPPSDMLRCYDEMIGQHVQYEALRKTTYTTQMGQSDDRDIGVGQDWTSTNLNDVQQLKPDGLFINWHHRALFRELCGPAWRYLTGRAPGVPPSATQHTTLAPRTWQILLTYRQTGKKTGPR